MKCTGGLNGQFLLFLPGCTSNEMLQNPETAKITTALGVSTQVQLGGSGVQAGTSVQADATHSGSTHQSSQAVQ